MAGDKESRWHWGGYSSSSVNPTIWSENWMINKFLNNLNFFSPKLQSRVYLLTFQVKVKLTDIRIKTWSSHVQLHPTTLRLARCAVVQSDVHLPRTESPGWLNLTTGWYSYPGSGSGSWSAPAQYSRTADATCQRNRRNPRDCPRGGRWAWRGQSRWGGPRTRRSPAGSPAWCHRGTRTDRAPAPREREKYIMSSFLLIIEINFNDDFRSLCLIYRFYELLSNIVFWKVPGTSLIWWLCTSKRYHRYGT